MVTERLIYGTIKIVNEDASIENATTVEIKVTEQIIVGQMKRINKITLITSSLV